MPASHPTTEPWLRRVQALLAKAESTEFPPEAETLLTKAQELMARHAIDEAMLRSSGAADGHGVASETIVVPTPYAGPNASLLCRVAEANGCQAVIMRGGRGPHHCVLVGHRSDLARATTLFAALSMHATRTMLRAEVPPFDTPRRFRHAFLLSFASRVGERLREATRVAQVDAAQASGPSVQLVLADRREAVQRAFEEQFPHIRMVRRQASSIAGARSGRAAADSAALSQRNLRASARGLEAG